MVCYMYTVVPVVSAEGGSVNLGVNLGNPVGSMGPIHVHVDCRL